MTVTVNLTPAEEARLSSEAIQYGLAPAELVAKVLREHLTSDTGVKQQAVLSKLHRWQKETGTETSPVVSVRELFAQWNVEASGMTDAEHEAEDRIWDDFERGINETRASLGMRQL